MSSCLRQRMLHGNVRTFNVIFKKMEEESSRAFELALEGHSLFISGQISLLLAAISIFSKHKRRVRKFEFFDFILLKEIFREEMR